MRYYKKNNADTVELQAKLKQKRCAYHGLLWDRSRGDLRL